MSGSYFDVCCAICIVRQGEDSLARSGDVRNQRICWNGDCPHCNCFLNHNWRLVGTCNLFKARRSCKYWQCKPRHCAGCVVAFGLFLRGQWLLSSTKGNVHVILSLALVETWRESWYRHTIFLLHKNRVFRSALHCFLPIRRVDWPFELWYEKPLGNTLKNSNYVCNRPLWLTVLLGLSKILYL